MKFAFKLTVGERLILTFVLFTMWTFLTVVMQGVVQMQGEMTPEFANAMQIAYWALTAGIGLALLLQPVLYYGRLGVKTAYEKVTA